MSVESVRESLASVDAAGPMLRAWGVRDLDQGWHNLRQLAGDLGTERLSELVPWLDGHLPRCADSDMALNNLERFLARREAADQLPFLIDNRARTLEILVQLLGISQFFSELLVAHPDYTPMLRVPLRRSPSREELQAQLQADVTAAFEDSAVLRTFRRYREQHVLRIGANDIIRDRPLEEVTRDIARVADVAVQVALDTAIRAARKRLGTPHGPAGAPARCAVFAFGKLGGKELNYSSDIDLMVVYDQEGETRGRAPVSNGEFFARVTTEMVRLLSAHPQAYRVDLRLRPEGQRGPLARSLASTLSYYDTLGRTWERQAMIKVRPIAGDPALGQEFMRAIEPWVYRKYLSFAEINEIKALKRKIEHKTGRAGASEIDVKTGHGGIRDVEFVIQFLQLANGGDLPEIRLANTMKAIVALEDAGCLTDQESRILQDTYRFLRKVEHRLQLMFDLQTHRLPDGADELHKLALRMGYRSGEGPGSRVQGSVSSDTEQPGTDRPHEVPEAESNTLDPGPWTLNPGALAEFLHDYREKTAVNRHILNHLLHEAFQGDASRPEPEADLILIPDPDPEMVRQVLGRYPFKDVQGAYQNLLALSQESVPFLSARRCRHFLASIAPQLLRILAETPDPDMALTNLEKVTASLGAKGVLWELFSFNPPSLKLYVDLCAWSQSLSEILITNPGMIDELLDSLVLNQPKTAQELRSELNELCRGASDTDLILHSFRDKELLRIGVNDILGKDTLQTTTAGLSDLAETILAKIAELQYPPLTDRYGVPHLADGPRAGQPSRYVILGLGKLGGREMNYNSDLDIILIYEGDGRTTPMNGGSTTHHSPLTTHHSRIEETSNYHFFSEFAQRIIKATSQLGPRGRLYAVDMRLRPTGRSGSLVIPLAEFRRYYAGGGAQLWERQALTRGRVVGGDVELGPEVMAAVGDAAYGLPWRPEFARDIAHMRKRLEASRSDRDLKRGFGGIVDVEFLVQLYQLKYGRDRVGIRSPNVWSALDALKAERLIPAPVHEELRDNYAFLRLVESRLRIVYNLSLDELPSRPEDMEKLARRLGHEPGPDGSPTEQFLRAMERRTTRTRELFLELVERERR